MEPTFQRVHEDHIAAKGENYLNHYISVQKFFPMKKATRSPDAKAAVEKMKKNSERFKIGSLDKVKSKKEVILEAQRHKNKVLFCVIDGQMSSRKTAELEPKFQKYKGRVAALTERGSSASQMNAAKVTDVIARQPDCDGHAADAIPACTLR